MSNESLSSNLHSLLPTLVGPLPPDLLSLSTSLLAQSRSRISNLKPNEEIARSFVCAHLACERLKNAIDLPPINLRPPLQKKAYDSLITHFRKSLPTNTLSTVSTVRPSRRKLEPQEQEPTDVDEECEERIRKMCSDVGVVPEAATYIIQGVRATSHQVEERDSLIAALALVVFECMSAEHIAADINGVRWERGDASLQKKKKSIVADLVGRKATTGGVKKWLKFLEQDMPPQHENWVATIPNGVGLIKVTKTEEPSWTRDRMLHSGVDYLADARVKTLENWKAHWLKMCGIIDGAS